MDLKFVKDKFVSFFEKLGEFYLFMFEVVKLIFKRPFRIKLVFDQIENIGVNSVFIVSLASLSVGMILALQIVYIMRMFRSEIMAGATVAMAYGREMAPVMTALMVIARNGSSMSAELGTMRVTEQIDAMKTMSVNPIHYLVVPRVIAAVVVFPFLTAFSNVVGVTGGYIVSVLMEKVNKGAFLEQMFWYTDPVDIYSGIMKSAVLGFIVSVICSYHGFYTTGGAKGVGESTTRAVVVSAIAILVADYFMSYLMVLFLY